MDYAMELSTAGVVDTISKWQFRLDFEEAEQVLSTENIYIEPVLYDAAWFDPRFWSLVNDLTYLVEKRVMASKVSSGN